MLGIAHSPSLLVPLAMTEEKKMKLRLPWQRSEPAVTTLASPSSCTHPRIEVEMHGTVIKRRWCALCGQDLPVEERTTEA